MSIAESGPQSRRWVANGFTKEISGSREKVVFKNPGELKIVWFRGQAYIEKEGNLALASDEVLAKLRKLELERG